VGTKKRAATEEEAEAALVFYTCTVSDGIQRFWKKKGKKVERGKGQEHATTKSTRRTTTPTNSHNKQLCTHNSLCCYFPAQHLISKTRSSPHSGAILDQLG
jgi:hypothetical protein